MADALPSVLLNDLHKMKHQKNGEFFLEESKKVRFVPLLCWKNDYFSRLMTVDATDTTRMPHRRMPYTLQMTDSNTYIAML